MSTFKDLYEAMERTLWNSLTKKLFSFMLLFVVNLGYLAIWMQQRAAVEAALQAGGAAPATLTGVAAAFDSGLHWMLGLSALGGVLDMEQADEAFIDRGPENSGFVVEADGRPNPDLTVPIVRLADMLGN